MCNSSCFPMKLGSKRNPIYWHLVILLCAYFPLIFYELMTRLYKVKHSRFYIVFLLYLLQDVRDDPFQQAQQEQQLPIAMATYSGRQPCAGTYFELSNRMFLVNCCIFNCEWSPSRGFFRH